MFESAGDPFRDRRRTGRRHVLRARVGSVAAVAAGGALGGPARYALEARVTAPAAGYPWATFSANVAGAFVLGLLLVLILDLWPPRRYLRPFLAVGFIGSFTTFSTWMVEVGELVSGGSPLIAVLYLSGSLTAGLAATGLGLLVGRAVARRRRKISRRRHKTSGQETT